MLIAYRSIAWLVFAGLVLYLYWVWKDEEKAKQKLEVVRKCWYLIFVLGALIYWTFTPNSIFTDWKNYLIVAVLFVLVDTFIFLGLYIKKIGTNELDSIAKTVEQNNMDLESTREKIKDVLHILNNEGITGYYGSEDEYLEGLGYVIEAYAGRQGLSYHILKFETFDEQESALRNYVNQRSLKSKLLNFEVCTVESKGFIPTIITNKRYVIELSSENTVVSDVDTSLISILLVVYDIVVQILEGSGGE